MMLKSTGEIPLFYGHKTQQKGVAYSSMAGGGGETRVRTSYSATTLANILFNLRIENNTQCSINGVCSIKVYILEVAV